MTTVFHRASGKNDIIINSKLKKTSGKQLHKAVSDNI